MQKYTIAKLDQIEGIMNNDGSGDIIHEYVSMPCRMTEGELTQYASSCTNANLNTIINHYKLRRELELINRKVNK